MNIYMIYGWGGKPTRFTTTKEPAYNWTVLTDGDSNPLIGGGYETEEQATTAMRAVLRKYDSHGMGASGMVREAHFTGFTK